MRRGLLVAIPAAIVALLLWWRHDRAPHTTTITQPATTTPAGERAATSTAAETTPRDAPSSARVRILPAEERRRLGAQIAAAIQRAHAATTATTGGAAAEDPIIPVEAVGKPLHDALEASLPILAECYTKHGSVAAPPHATARMTMASDPDLGTVIDTDQIKDADDTPLPPDLETCLRDTIDSLALPPLGQPGKLQLQYTFRFD